MNHSEIMQLGLEKARQNMRKNMGGPFGAVVVKDGEVIAISSNQVFAPKRSYCAC